VRGQSLDFTERNKETQEKAFMRKNHSFRIKTLIWASLIFQLLFSLPSYAQKPKQHQATIQLIDKMPLIDGQLDTALSYLSKRTFNYFWRFDNPVTDSIKMSYRLGYTPTHFYIYIEAETDSITYRDRGFINGDGFKLLFAMPQTDTGSNEYYDIVFSPSKDKKYRDRKRIWEYNRRQDHGKKLSASTLFEEKAGKGHCGFEVLIAWKDIAPYHPWFVKEIGYNLYFAKGIGKDITNGYAEIEDEGIWDEEIPLRKYTIMQFEAPRPVAEPVILTELQERNLKEGQLIIVRTATIGKIPAKHTLHVVLRKDSSSILLKKDIDISIGKELRRVSFLLDTKGILPGTYNLEIDTGVNAANYSITILPDIAFQSIAKQISANKNKLTTGVANTLLFKLNLLQQKISSLKKYETGEAILSYWNTFQQEYTVFLKGTDPYKDIVGSYRRAFRSKHDGTYQPYTIKLPANYDPGKKYPLLVFLHGSGQDEQKVLNDPRSDGSFIELAPFARDMYRCYSSDSSQNDIIEAIEDVCKHFSVDKTRMVIGGFSMGGYGALRTYFEHPAMYKGVAVFAGHPSLATEWLGEGHPDFLNEKYLSMFSGIPVFVYHGKKDGALPVQQAELLIQQLKQHRATVTDRLIDSKAHEYPDEETNQVYFKWLKKSIDYSR
jgi:predicted esterase